MEEDEICVSEEHKYDEGDDVAHAVVRVEQELAARLGEVVDAMTRVENLEQKNRKQSLVLTRFEDPD